ncbi:hypothetical protein [Amycolatopsis suaedae]|uniref:Uncharacterized protein n=1 Tax=Amycolatopsis suaedae TaxID=2510978 RepID=A0A4Q7J7K4_9PSEU|nr:hypothetical protein [Amycolatopsis suaedae]RZQ62856.1 hypothetical protein EWH70_18175 [Amycolatopsis suaedae]
MSTPGWQGPPVQQRPHRGWPAPMPGPPPRRGSRVWLVVTLVTVPLLLLLGGGVTVFVLYQQAHEPGGEPPTGARLGAACSAVSDGTLARMRTTNPTPRASSEDSTHTQCAWGQTRGRDGDGSRDLVVVIRKITPERQAELRCGGVPKPQPALGERACLSVQDMGGTIREAHLQIIDRDTFYLVQYSGWDVGFLDNVPIPDDVLIEAVTDVGNEVLAHS